jgi:hypothetical protein
MNLTLADFFEDEQGPFIKAFRPLQHILNQQAEDCHKNKRFEDQFLPWLTGSGKGGKPEYIDFTDVSLYRHCMEVATLASMSFFYAWQHENIPHPELPKEMLKADDTETAEKLLKQIFALAFLHDADKYWQAPHSSSPSLEQVQKLHELLKVEQWAHLEVNTSFTLVSAMEKRGEGNAFFTALKPSLTHQKILEMLKRGDKITSVGSREGLEAMLDYYNNQQLPALHQDFNVPNISLKLLVFRYSPIILHKLQYCFLYEFYANNTFPLICLLEGQQFWISVPQNFDLNPVFEHLADNITFTEPDIKRNATNGEVSLFDIFSAIELIKAVHKYDRESKLNASKLLAVHLNDWDIVQEYIQAWIGQICLEDGDVSLVKKAEKGKLLATVTPETTPPSKYRYALAMATALRGNAKGKIFEQRLENWTNQYPDDQVVLQKQFPNWSDFKKDTRQTLLAMQAALNIEDEEELQTAIVAIYGNFPPPSEQDEGAATIIAQLKKQCGLEQSTTHDTVYTAPAKGGNCLLCGYPTTQPIESSKMKLAGVKSSAFNNRIGHRKNIWTQSDKNYLCPACIKQQTLLCEMQPKLKAEPLIVATPFRALIKPIDTTGESRISTEGNVINSFHAMSKKDWMRILPWNIDASSQFPFVLESMDAGFDNAVDAMYRWAMFALYSGNPVHIFIASQRECQASFLFEQTPPLIRKLLADLSVSQPDLEELSPESKKRLKQRLVKKQLSEIALISDEHGTIRRFYLPKLVKRLELFRTILRTNHGHEVLAAMLEFGWWAVAWLQMISASRNVQPIDLAKTEYPMNQQQESSKLQHIAYLAAQIQRFPGYDASNSDKYFCLDAVLEQFDTSNRYPLIQSDSTARIAGMAGELEKRLNSGRSRHAKNGEGGSVSQRCQLFAHAVFTFILDCEKAHRLDARFRRFLRAAYSHLFMAQSLAHSQKNKESESELEASQQKSLI